MMSAFTWNAGPLTGRRIRVIHEQAFIARGYVYDKDPDDDGVANAEREIPVGATGTVGPLAPLDEVNMLLYNPGTEDESLNELYRCRSRYGGEEFCVGPEYLVLWDRRPDNTGGGVDSYHEGEILEHTVFAERKD